MTMEFKELAVLIEAEIMKELKSHSIQSWEINSPCWLGHLLDFIFLIV